MGIFRRRAKKNREIAAADLPVEQVTTAPTAVPRRDVMAETRPDPDQPGWGRIIGQEIGKAREHRASQG